MNEMRDDDGILLDAVQRAYRAAELLLVTRYDRSQILQTHVEAPQFQDRRSSESGRRARSRNKQT